MIYVFQHKKHGSSLAIALSSENQSLNNVAIVTALVFIITRIIMKQMEGKNHLSFSAPLKLLKAVSCAVVLDGLSYGGDGKLGPTIGNLFYDVLCT